MKVNTPNKTNPQKSGMENFLSAPSPAPETKSPETKNLQISKSKEEEIIEQINDIEQKLKNIKELELSTFTNIVYDKHLIFKLLFIREKIYTIVKDSQTNKSVIVAISPPRWGGSSLRYLISNCAAQYCKAVEKQTSKGKIITYSSLVGSASVDEELDDIFE